jgi:hypothetical protein
MNEVLFVFIVVNCGANCGETERVVGDGGLYEKELVQKISLDFKLNSKKFYLFFQINKSFFFLLYSKV